MTPTPDPRTFYTETIPVQFNRSLDDHPSASEEERRTLEGLRAVNATICVDVKGEGGGTFYLNIRAGRMSSEESAAHPPFLTLIQDRSAFQTLVHEAGDSALALLGGLSGLAGEMKLTHARIRSLDAVRGMIRFEVSGDEGFALLTHFGPDPVPDEPAASITVDPAAYQELRSGALDPAQAFMDGKIQVEGDMQLAMQLALAAIAPD